MATIAGVDFMNRKQLRAYARNLGVQSGHNNFTTNASLITALKAA